MDSKNLILRDLKADKMSSPESLASWNYHYIDSLNLKAKTLFTAFSETCFEFIDKPHDVEDIVIMNVWYPFYGKVGAQFNCVLDDVNHTYYSCRLLEIISIERDEDNEFAKIKVKIEQKGDFKDFINAYDLKTIIRYGPYPFYPGPRGDFELERRVKYNPNNTFEKCNITGSSEWIEWHVIFTDENDIDHLVMVETQCPGICRCDFVDLILGYHSDGPWK